MRLCREDRLISTTDEKLYEVKINDPYRYVLFLAKDLDDETEVPIAIKYEQVLQIKEDKNNVMEQLKRQNQEHVESRIPKKKNKSGVKPAKPDAVNKSEKEGHEETATRSVDLEVKNKRKKEKPKCNRVASVKSSDRANVFTEAGTKEKVEKAYTLKLSTGEKETIAQKLKD
eukprot:Seg8640.1 transcript_id=Seg8640.1/GoldUCD/mRNA.D3Y31 product="hypothetical protein" protein_id=Seg8640.1/GoldUCD/D3Y31